MSRKLSLAIGWATQAITSRMFKKLSVVNSSMRALKVIYCFNFKRLMEKIVTDSVWFKRVTNQPSKSTSPRLAIARIYLKIYLGAFLNLNIRTLSRMLSKRKGRSLKALKSKRRLLKKIKSNGTPSLTTWRRKELLTWIFWASLSLNLNCFWQPDKTIEKLKSKKQSTYQQKGQ